MDASCDEEVLKQTVNAVVRAVRSYLTSNCLRILSLSAAAGQEIVKIELLGFFRYYQPLATFPRFSDAIKYLKQCNAVDRIWREMPFFEWIGDRYVVINVGKLRDACLDLIKPAEHNVKGI